MENDKLSGKKRIQYTIEKSVQHRQQVLLEFNKVQKNVNSKIL